MRQTAHVQPSARRAEVRWLASWGLGNVFTTSAEVREVDYASAFVELPLPCARERLFDCRLWVQAFIPELSGRLTLFGRVADAGWNSRYRCEGVELQLEECPPLLRAFLALDASMPSATVVGSVEKPTPA